MQRLTLSDRSKEKANNLHQPNEFLRTNVTFQSYADCKQAATNCSVGESAINPFEKQLLNVPLQYYNGSKYYVFDNVASNASLMCSPEQRVRKNYVYNCSLHKDCSLQVNNGMYFLCSSS